MSTVPVDVTKWAGVQRAFGARIVTAIRRGLLSGAMRALPVLQAATRSAPPANPGGAGMGGAVNTGRYLAAWRARPLAGGVEVTNAATYSGVIEYGRRAGSRVPPREVIARWAQRRLGLSRKAALAAAWPIARAIARRGLRPRRVFADTFADLRKLVLDEVRVEVQREIDAIRGGP